MSAEQRRELSRRGGRAAQAAGTAHRFTSEEARAAGSKGGRAKAKNKREREVLDRNCLFEPNDSGELT